MIKDYELSCLISNKVDEIERDTIIENINDLIKKRSGEIMGSHSISEVTLGYPIKGENKAQLLVLNFKYENNDLMDLKKEIENDKKIIRCLLKKISPRKKIHLRRRRPKEEGEKVELGDIDKKIEEIFNPAQSPSSVEKDSSDKENKINLKKHEFK